MRAHTCWKESARRIRLYLGITSLSMACALPAWAACDGFDDHDLPELTCEYILGNWSWQDTLGKAPLSDWAPLCDPNSPDYDPNHEYLTALLDYYENRSGLSMPPQPEGTCSDYRRARDLLPEHAPPDPNDVIASCLDPNDLDPAHTWRIMEDRHRWAHVEENFSWNCDYWKNKPEKTKRLGFLETLIRGYKYSCSSTCNPECCTGECVPAIDPNELCDCRDELPEEWVALANYYNSNTSLSAEFPYVWEIIPSPSMLAAAHRIVNWVHGHEELVGKAASPAMDPESHRDLLIAIFRNAEYLLTPAAKHDSNQGITRAHALMLAGYYFNEFAQSSCWRKKGINRSDTLAKSQFFDDGMPVEGTFGYHQRSVRKLGEAAWLYRMNDPNLHSAAEADTTFYCTDLEYSSCPDPQEACCAESPATKLQNAAGTVALLAQADHRFAAIGDASRHNVETEICLYARIYEKAEWAFIALDGDTTDSSCTRDPNNPVYPTAPQKTDEYFPDGRLFRFRSAWTVPDPNDPNGQTHVFDRNGIQVLFHAIAGEAEPSHGHDDNLSIEVFGYGQSLVVDPGAYRLGEGDDNGSCYESINNWKENPGAHNVFSEVGYNDNLGGDVGNHAFRDGFAFARISASVGEGLDDIGKRHLFYVRPDWVFVSDRGEELDDDVQQSFMLGPTPQNANHSAENPESKANVMRYSYLRAAAELPAAPCMAYVDPNECDTATGGAGDAIVVKNDCLAIRLYSMSNLATVDVEVEGSPSSHSLPNSVFPVSGMISHSQMVRVVKDGSGGTTGIHSLLVVAPPGSQPELSFDRLTVKSGGQIRTEKIAFGVEIAEQDVSVDRRYFVDMATPPVMRKYYASDPADSWVFRGKAAYFQSDSGCSTSSPDLRIRSTRKLIWKEGLQGECVLYKTCSGKDLDVEVRDGVVKVYTDSGNDPGDYRIYSPATTELYENGTKILSGWSQDSSHVEMGSCP